MKHEVATPLNRAHKAWTLLALDLLLIVISYLAASLLLSGTERWGFVPAAAPTDLLVLLVTGALATVLLDLHKIDLAIYQMQGFANSALVAVGMANIAALASPMLAQTGTPIHVFVVTGLIFLILSVSARLLLRHRRQRRNNAGQPCAPVIIYGAGQTGQQLVAALASDDSVRPVAFADDNPRLQGQIIAGLGVYAPTDIPQLVQHHHAERIILAMPSASAAVQSRIIRGLSPLGCNIHALPSFANFNGRRTGKGAGQKSVDLNALLGRDRLEEDLPGVSETYHSRSILVTGAGGSIGSEICRQLMAFNPERVVLMDHSELLLFEIDRELRHLGTEIDIQPVLGSVCERDLVTGVMAKYKVDTVLHAAAYKHVPLVEYNALEGMRNNVLGTKVVADAAREAGVERFILVSTDKAVRPSSIMGASKRFAELLIQDLATRSTTTRFAMVRFGNVLGSSGSVIPLFQEQIARGGPITLTHNDITRYFMTIPEAVQLVLLAGTFARGGDVFVLDMGKPVPIRDVARKMIQGAGLSVRDESNPEGDIEIEITGLRPGEKMHEELLIGSDMLTTPHKRILRAQENHLSEIEMANALNALGQAIETRNPKLMNETLSKWIERADQAKPVIVNE
ncbi:nucleoside-diphosphate sugar epimerase/dehydratase [uncultured Roseovarius sp.]|uniref:polysaccharide biosynthesis protein n=1 Tax=uncultured Roseovarius sp. TaxID=293344 RepID=UPI00260A8075|nr:nucleoside-diphosphate sugar epimerase/dehydratase [uncultured Roseovarius sp.]